MEVLRKKVMTGKMRARQLANSLWALAKLSHDNKDDLLAITKCMEGVCLLLFQGSHVSITRHTTLLLLCEVCGKQGMKQESTSFLLLSSLLVHSATHFLAFMSEQHTCIYPMSCERPAFPSGIRIFGPQALRVQVLWNPGYIDMECERKGSPGVLTCCAVPHRNMAGAGDEQHSVGNGNTVAAEHAPV